ncbi:hypothetical protein NA8A_10923 [Nitratireductor indicus C115]|uniref:DUF1468 domain-containing protein n=1 Tax=Nitratireductor indicus C115 TaxID=1231190 RepID=K2NTF6_9HYPH|nr:tripartite tricarboxylate transporter TctB family protein [Nitratireductor indicus]EKF42570.1 hypothetical protein NA8A_10923 [Nitratireductor indicus C115]SFQ57451.1 hypothetical protein SAMN05216176_106218 [Nitratireductor indicus]
MSGRLTLTHTAFLALVALVTSYISWSAIKASTKLFNLIVVVPVAAIIAILIVTIVASALRGKASDGAMPSRANTLGDILLLGCFAVFCVALTKVGFDIATFIFVWIGIVLGGEKRIWLPPLFSALFTLILVKGFGALFPFPMPMLVF